MKIVIFGGSGFIGRHLVKALAASERHHVIVPTRDRERAKSLIVLPATDVIAYTPSLLHSVSPYLDDADVVVNLIGVLNESNDGEFVRVHNEFARLLCNACVTKKIPRIIHISAINTTMNAPSEYLRSKAAAEEIIRGASLRYVIIRPAVVFGAGDSLTSLFIKIAKKFPLMALPCATAIMQPIAVEDVVAVIKHAIETSDEDNKTLTIAGPEEMTLLQIVNASLAAAAINRRVIGLNPLLSYITAAIMEAIPGINILSRDNCLSASLPAITSQNDAARIVGVLTTLTAYLAKQYDSHPANAIIRAHLRR